MLERRYSDESIIPVHTLDPQIVGLALGEVRHDHAGKAQVYLGGDSITHLTYIGDESLRDGAVQVSMFTIDGSSDTDYAVVTVTPPTYNRTLTQKAIAIRSGGSGLPATYVERTPIQRFTSERNFTDIPISGIARWLALSPDGEFSSGNFSSYNPAFNNTIAKFGEGWTFTWVADGGAPFVFGELCSPRFIDETPSCPVGEAGITELDNTLNVLPDEFRVLLSAYTSGEHLRNTEANRAAREWVTA